MKIDFFKNRNVILSLIAAAGIIITGAVIMTNNNPDFSFASLGFGQSNQQIAQKAVDYINNNDLASEDATLVEVSEESGLVKFKIKIGSSEFDSYATKDGKLLFPQVIALNESGNTDNGNTVAKAGQTCDSLAKTDKPIVQAFVVSRCPFGLQMQRLMAEAVKTDPSIAENMKVRYIGAVSGNTITAMHGQAEAQENLRQICIREEQPAKYWDYVACQMKASGTESSCEQSTGVNSSQLSSCISDVSRGVAYAKEDFDLSAQYDATASPTLIVGDAQVSEFDFGGRSPEALKQIICCSSNNQPGFCSTQFNTASAATSFSNVYEGSGSTSAVNCEV